MAAPPKYIGREEVMKLLDSAELLLELESALGKFSSGKDGGVQQPLRSVINVEKHHGFLAVMPGYSATDDALASKLVSFYPENTSLPTHQAWIMLFDPSCGSLLAIIDGESVTSLRTGLASAVATKHLANPNSKILAILGSGVQAHSHFQAMSLVQAFEEVRVWSRTPANAQSFAEEIGAKVCETAEAAVRGADVICTVTFATTPVILQDWVKPGAHINVVGACRPEWQEIDSNLMRSAAVYCDSREACLMESGDIILSECEIYAEIGEVINGQKMARWEETTIFKSVGLAIEDVISAKQLYDKYTKLNPAPLLTPP